MELASAADGMTPPTEAIKFMHAQTCEILKRRRRRGRATASAPGEPVPMTLADLDRDVAGYSGIIGTASMIVGRVEVIRRTSVIREGAQGVAVGIDRIGDP